LKVFILYYDVKGEKVKLEKKVIRLKDIITSKVIRTHQCAKFIVTKCFEIFYHNLLSELRVNYEKIGRCEVVKSDKWSFSFIFTRNIKIEEMKKTATNHTNKA
jgi:hypothetical protein